MEIRSLKNSSLCVINETGWFVLNYNPEDKLHVKPDDTLVFLFAKEGERVAEMDHDKDLMYEFYEPGEYGIGQTYISGTAIKTNSSEGATSYEIAYVLDNGNARVCCLSDMHNTLDRHSVSLIGSVVALVVDLNRYAMSSVEIIKMARDMDAKVILPKIQDGSEQHQKILAELAKEFGATIAPPLERYIIKSSLRTQTTVSIQPIK